MQLWLVEIAIEPKSKSKGDQDRLGVALGKLAAEDPSFLASIDVESGQTVLKGMSELHLDAKIGLLKQVCDVQLRIGAPQVAFRERITRPAEVDYTYKKQSGTTGQFARVKIIVEPGEPGKEFALESAIVDGALSKEHVSGVEKGIRSVLPSGVVAGFPVVDVKVRLVDGTYHDVDSSAHTFEIASRAALREALVKGNSILLEPIMKVEVATPADCAGSVIGDLNSRRSQLQDQGMRGGANVISAMVPLINMFGYAVKLGALSQARATFTMQFDHHAPAAPLPDNNPPFRPAIGMRP